jgi:hypothetical protein
VKKKKKELPRLRFSFYLVGASEKLLRSNQAAHGTFQRRLEAPY